MQRPLLLRIAPDVIRERIFYRVYLGRQNEFLELYKKAKLKFSNNACLYDLVPGDVISGNIAFNGFYELSLTRRICGLAKKGGLLVDVGANIGYFSILWASSHRDASAICYEASPRNVRLLKNNIERNDLVGRVSVVAKAAGKETGTIDFEVGPVEQTGWGGIANQRSATSITVPLCRLDEDLADKTIDVLKVDVEGADTWVLLGCQSLLRDGRIKLIFFEENTERMSLLGIRSGDAQTFLRDHGYACKPLGSRSGEWVAWPDIAS